MTTVIRFSSLGDIVLCASVTGQLGEVTFRTLPHYFGLVRRFPGVVGVLGPNDPPVGGRVVDLHNNLRSRRFSADDRVERFDLTRRMRVWFKTGPAPSVLSRHAAAARVSPSPPPWLAAVERGSALVLAPGSAHRTKRWPHFAALAAAWDGPVRVVGGPGDEAAVAALGGTVEVGFDRTLDSFQGAAVMVAGDTGLLHLAVAAGLPAVGLFGPTTSADGFFDYPPAAARPVELPLACRPCSRFGGETCPIGDHACMVELSVASVLAAARAQAGLV